ncbi:MAG: S8 family serine peptidase [Ferruginibacter sp.]
MKKIILFIFIGLFVANADSYAQFSKYIIRLKDKGTNPFSLSNPIQYLTQRSIDRRTRYSIAIDSTDLPITPRYIDSIRLAGAVTILNTSKWLNQVAIQTTDAAALVKISSFPFVLSAGPIAARSTIADKPVNKKLDAVTTELPGTQTPNTIAADYYNYGQSFGQVHLHNGEFLHNRGFRGQGMQMAVLDAGFFHYLTLPTFDSIRNNGQVLGTWDFVAGNASVDEDNAHGMNCLSTIAANMPGVFMGTAPKTSFYLYRTEDVNSEYPIEEQNWVAGIERADSLGIDISSTSLGYFTFDNAVFNYTYANMDGNTTLSARGADLAAKKGILCVFAAGNEGQGAWHYIITPSDADSVMAVGAVSTSGVVGGFSSYGPSSDGQIKPSVSAVGVNAVVANPSTGQPSFGSGTSFACPNMAGLTTCLWQAFPEINNMGIINVMQQSATRANSPDDRTGYGIPDMKKAFVKLIKQLYTQQSAVASCAVTLQWTAKTDSVISIVVERKLPAAAYTTISTQISTGAFQSRNFTYTDDLRNFPTSGIWYRFKMNIAADTSFYLDSILVNFTPRPNLGADKTVAACNSSTFNLTTQFTTTSLTTNWTLGGNPVANPAAVTASGLYQLIAINNSGCADTATVNLSFGPNLGADKSVSTCSGNTINLTTLFVTAGLTTNWTLGGNAVANPAAVAVAGVYQLIAVNAGTCSDTALVNVTINANPNLGADKVFTKCTDSTKNLTTVFTTTGLTTAWTLGGNAVANPVAVITAGTYQLIATNSFGCADTALVTITNNQLLCIVIPPPLPEQITFSPTDRPVSDILSVLIVRNSATMVGLVVHNSAGQLVYNLSGQQAAGGQTYSIPMKKFGKGVYYVTVRLNDKKEVIKRVIRQ